MKANGYSIGVIPLSWCLGRFTQGNRTVWALGPLRFVFLADIQDGE